MLVTADKLQHRVRLPGIHNSGHANAHIEDLIQFSLRDSALSGNDVEDREHFPGMFMDAHIAMWWQHARKVVDESAARNVREALDRPRSVSAIKSFQRLLNDRPVSEMHLQQLFANRVRKLRHAARGLQFQLLEENLSREAVAVRV